MSIGASGVAHSTGPVDLHLGDSVTALSISRGGRMVYGRSLADSNIWTRYIAKWKLTSSAPWIGANRPVSGLMAQQQKERDERVAGELARLKSNYAVTGIYMYDATVFQKISTCKPSQRNELEITDVNNAYIQEGTMSYSFLDGWWTDAGTFESLMRAANLVQQSRTDNNGTGHQQ